MPTSSSSASSLRAQAARRRARRRRRRRSSAGARLRRRERRTCTSASNALAPRSAASATAHRRGVGDAERVGGLAAERRQRRHDGDEHDDRDGHAHRDEERLLAQRCVISRRATSATAARPLQPAHAATALRNSSLSVGRSSAKWVTLPAPRAASSTRLGPGAVAQRDEHAVRPAVDDLGARDAGQPRLAAAADRDPHACVALRAARAQLVDPARRPPAGRP